MSVLDSGKLVAVNQLRLKIKWLFSIYGQQHCDISEHTAYITIGVEFWICYYH